MHCHLGNVYLNCQMCWEGETVIIGQDPFFAPCKHDKIFNRTDSMLVENMSENHEGHNLCCRHPNYVEILLIGRLNHDII